MIGSLLISGCNGDSPDNRAEPVAVGSADLEPTSTVTSLGERSQAQDGVAGAPGPPGKPSSPVTTPAADDTPDMQVGSGATGFAITVSNRDGRARVGVPVEVTGTQSRMIVTGEDGTARFQGPSGRYQLRIEPQCTDEVQVLTGATAQVAVPESEVVEGRLRVESRRRFAPTGRTTYRAENGSNAYGRRWPLDAPHIVTFTVVDRCNGAPSPGADFSSFTLSAPAGLRVQQQSERRADAGGMGQVRVTCTSVADDLELLAKDRTDSGDVVDLFSRANLDDDPPSCIAS